MEALIAYWLVTSPRGERIKSECTCPLAAFTKRHVELCPTLGLISSLDHEYILCIHVEL